MPDSADTGLEPVAPRSLSVELFVPAFLAASGAVSASTWIMEVEENVGKEGEETKGDGDEFQEMGCCRRRGTDGRGRGR